MTKDPEIACSFCGKSKSEVAGVVAGPTAFICNECVALCVGIFADTLGKPQKRTKGVAGLTNEQLIHSFRATLKAEDGVPEMIRHHITEMRKRAMGWAEIGTAPSMSWAEAEKKFS